MPSFENPFKSSPPKPRSSNDAKFVERILGAKEAADLESMTGKVPVEAKTPDRADAIWTSEEQANVKVEKRKDVWTKNQLYDWAEIAGLPDDWVDTSLVFHEDGSFECTGDLIVDGNRIVELPKGLVGVRGDVNVSHNKIASLEGFPEVIDGDLSLEFNPIKSLKGMPRKIGGSLYLDGVKLSSLEGLTQDIGGDLFLHHCELTSLIGMPSMIPGSIQLYNNKLTSLDGFPQTVGGAVSVSWNQLPNLVGLPSVINEDLHIDTNPLISLEGLPSSSAIKGKLYIGSAQKEQFGSELERQGYKIEEC